MVGLATLGLGAIILSLRAMCATSAPRSAMPPEPQTQTPSAMPVASAFFSMTMQSQVLQGMPWPSVKFGGIRLWATRTTWNDLNPSRGVYNWKQLDAWLDLAASHNVDVLYTFGTTPTWASSNPTGACTFNAGGCSPPGNLQDWDEFVRAIVSHAGGRIKYWELWNEPNLSEFWGGGVPTMVTMAQRAYNIIRSVAPTALILTPSPTRGAIGVSTWLDQYFAAGGGAYADVVAFHGYPYNNPVSAESINGIVDSLTATTSKYGQSSKPIWDTEASWGQATTLPNLDDQMAYAARSYVLHWSKGVSRLYWYAWNDASWGTLWNAGAKTTLKPGIAYASAYNWLVGATMSTPCSTGTNSTWTCGLTRPGGYEAEVVWNTSVRFPATVSYAPASQFAQYRDLEGNVVPITGAVQVGSKPILLERLTALALSQPFLKFDSVPVGVPATAQTFVVTNTGAAPLLIAGVEATGDFSVLSGCGDSIAIGTSCTVQVGFVPTAPGSRTGTLLIHDNASGAPHTVLLTNTNPPNAIWPFPSSLDFSGQVIGVAPIAREVTLTNLGDQAVIVGGPSIDNGTESDFSIIGSTCSVTLAPGAACVVDVTFSPSTMGAQTAALNLSGGSGTTGITSVPLSGMGWDFSLNAGGGSPASVSPDQIGSYNVVVTPQGGFEGTIALAVSCNVSGIASCQVIPSSVSLTDASPVTINVQTSASMQTGAGSARLDILVGIVATLLFGMAFRFRSLTALVLALVFLVGCAGVTGNSGQGTPTSSPPSIVVTGAAQGGMRTLSLPVSPS